MGPGARAGAGGQPHHRGCRRRRPGHEHGGDPAGRVAVAGPEVHLQVSGHQVRQVNGKGPFPGEGRAESVISNVL